MLLELIARGFERRSSVVNPLHPRDPALSEMFGFGSQTKSGITVNEKTALTHSPVWRAVNIRSSLMGDLPLGVYKRRADGGRTLIREHHCYALLHDLCNSELFLTPFSRQQLAENHSLMWGNECAWIERRRDGKPVNLWPHPPGLVELGTSKSGGLFYTFNSPHEAAKTYGAGDVLHHKGMSPDGVWGWSRIRMARESIGQALAAQQFGGAWFGQGSRPGVIITTAPGFRPEDAKLMKESITSQVNGPDGWHRPLVVPMADKVVPVTVPPEDAQFLGTQEFGVSEAARWFDVPLVYMMLPNSEPRANAEQDSLNFVMTTIAPECKNHEQELNIKLLSPAERAAGIFIEHNLDALLRGDFKSRMDGYVAGVNNGLFTRDEVRRRENLDPIGEADGGEIITIPVNSMNIKAVINQTEPAGAAKPGGDPKPPAAPPAKREAPAVDWLATFAPLFDGAAAYLLVKEQKGIDALVAKHGARAAIAPFYAGHGDAVRYVLAPIMRAMAGPESGPAVAGIAERYCDMAQRVEWPKWKAGGSFEFLRDECRKAVAFFKGDENNGNT